MKTLSVLVAPGVLADYSTIELDDAERHHLKVRRVDVAAEVLVFDGAGKVARGTLAVSGAALTVGMVEQVPPPPELILAVGAGDKERFIALAERCTELGVTRLVPLATERSGAVDTRLRDSAVEKANRRAREACKQSENPWATVVTEICTMDGLGARHRGVRWLLAAAGAAPCPPLSTTEAIGWLVGPEGGFAPEEIAFAFEQLGATSAGLAPAVLRFDTAAAAAAAITHDRRAMTKE